MDRIAWLDAAGQVRLTTCVSSIDEVVSQLVSEGIMPPGTSILRNPEIPEGQFRALRIINGRLERDPAPEPLTFRQRVDAAKTIDDMKNLLKELR